MSTKTRFEEEAKGNSEMAYSQMVTTCVTQSFPLHERWKERLRDEQDQASV